MTLHDETLTREKTEQIAYRLWQEAGCPEGQAERFWREAEGLMAAPQGLAPKQSLPEREPMPQAAPARMGWRAAAGRYFAAWWAHPSKPAAR